MIDRDAAAGLLLSYVLETEGYQVCLIRDEWAAWYEIGHKRFDVVVMDLTSQGAGLAILKSCRSQMTCVPALFVSVGPSCVQAWRPVGTLRRPYGIDTLLRVLRGTFHEPALEPCRSGIARPGN